MVRNSLKGKTAMFDGRGAPAASSAPRVIRAGHGVASGLRKRERAS